jgi:hypothetical protein
MARRVWMTGISSMGGRRPLGIGVLLGTHRTIVSLKTTGDMP